jgi:uncharacterized repeat protein (TIGR01451 family)
VFVSGTVAIPAANDTSIPSPDWSSPSSLSTQHYQWVAYYSGDTNNSRLNSGCGNEPFTLTPTPTPAISLTKLESFSSSSGFVHGPITGNVGQTVYYEMLVTDTGNTTLTLNFGDNGCDSAPQGPFVTVPTYNSGSNTLSPGGQVEWTCSHVLTAADVAGYTNTATVIGTAPDGTQVNARDSVIAYSDTPGMQVVKLQRDGTSGGFTTSQITGSVGDTIDYEIQVTNTGNVPLTLSLSDPHCDSGTIAGPFSVSGTLNGDVLAPGGVAQYTCSHVLSASDIPSFTNVGTITGNPPSGPPLTGTGIVVANVTQAAIKVLKLQSLSATGPFTTSELTTTVGHTVYYEIQATNTGNAPLTLSINDPECDSGSLSGPVALSGSLSGGVLSPGGEAQYTCSHVMRSGDANPFTNTAIVTGTPPSGPPVSGTASVVTKRAAVLKIQICKTPNGKVIRYHGKRKPKACHPKLSHIPQHIHGFTG